MIVHTRTLPVVVAADRRWATARGALVGTLVWTLVAVAGLADQPGGMTTALFAALTTIGLVGVWAIHPLTAAPLSDDELVAVAAAMRVYREPRAPRHRLGDCEAKTEIIRRVSA